MRVILHSEAAAELRDAFLWYESKAGNLGHDLLDEVEDGIERIREKPDTWPLYTRAFGVRRFLIHRFPFGILYRVEPTRIYVLAVSHLNRKPTYWEHRLADP